MTTAEFVNAIDPDEMAHNGTSHLDLWREPFHHNAVDLKVFFLILHTLNFVVCILGSLRVKKGLKK